MVRRPRGLQCGAHSHHQSKPRCHAISPPLRRRNSRARALFILSLCLNSLSLFAALFSHVSELQKKNLLYQKPSRSLPRA